MTHPVGGDVGEDAAIEIVNVQIVIRTLEKLKLVWNVKTPSPALVERRRKGAVKAEPAIGD